MRSVFLIVAAVVCVVLIIGNCSAAEDLGFKVPEGFEVSLYAGDDLAHDIYSMTIDSHGRVVVAGRGYVKILHDDDADGRADRATLFSNKPASGAHGMYFDGDDLLCTGDDALMKLRDTNADGVADREPEIWSKLRSPEHGANGVAKGPDGWIYVVCGNDAEVSEAHATTKTSPVTKPQCGAIVRFSPDGKQSEIVAHGFRNPYDIDFNSTGHLFTVDADGERDQYLPWYAPCRLFDVQEGAHHGWVLRGWTRSWNRPAYFNDNVERLVEIGRGSPTGFVIYRHRQFPKQYRDGAFSACWTLGKIYPFPLTPSGSSYKSTKNVFMETTGTTGFAPVDLAVGPDGSMFVAIGGRGTRGSVFRVRYAAEPLEKARYASDVERALRADQPLASWSRNEWVPLAKELGAKPLLEFLADEKRPSGERVRAAQLLSELMAEIPDDELIAAMRSPDGPVAAASLKLANTLYAQLGSDWAREHVNRAVSHLANFPENENLITLRAAWEVTQARRDCVLPIRVSDRRVNGLCIQAQQMTGFTPELQSRLQTPNYLTGLIAVANTPKSETSDRYATEALATLSMRIAFMSDDAAENIALLSSIDSKNPQTQLRIARLLQLAIGDVRTVEKQPDLYAGYAAADEKRAAAVKGTLAEKLKSYSPAKYSPTNFEIARLCGMLQVDDPSIALWIALAPTGKTSPVDDIHYLIVLSRLPAKRDAAITVLSAEALVALHPKMAERKWESSRNWSLVVGELFDELCKRDAKLAETLAARSRFGLPEHSLFAARMQGDVRTAAAQRMIEYAQAHDDVRWTPEMVGVVAGLPAEESLPLLREQWSEAPMLRDAIALVLAKQPAVEDRARLVASLGSTQSDVVRTAAGALRAMPTAGKPRELAAAIATLRSYAATARGDARALRPVREELAKLLGHWTKNAVAEIDETKVAKTPDGKSIDVAAAYQPWFAWFERSYPDEAKRLAQSPGVNEASWAKRLAAIDWKAGDAVLGKASFEKRSCVRCHGGNGPLGPDLSGVGRRFAREDLLAAIYDPNRDVSPLYQTTQVTTRGGQTYFGLLVYESPEGSLVQTGPDTTIRVTDEDTSARRTSKQSLMPTGLLDQVPDAELADLYRYLQGK